LDHQKKTRHHDGQGMPAGLMSFTLWLALRLTPAAAMPATNAPTAIPWNEIGAQASANYHGDGLAVKPAGSGACLHCVFQRLDGEATAEGLWLASTVTNTMSDRFRVRATAVGRTADDPNFNAPDSAFSVSLAGTGEVSVCGQTVRFRRPGLTEEYSVSLDGVRQDFIVGEAPPSPPAGELVVKLAVSGAQVEPVAGGARLVLENSGRKIAYSRLRVTDATGKELPARMEALSAGDEVAGVDSWAVFDKDIEALSLLTSAPAREELAVVVNDANAVYPVRIDPTFSDANWVSMGGLPGANGAVQASAIDGSGNLYIGGDFTIVGNTFATNIAKWSGSSWSALGSGIGGGESDSSVFALAVSGSTLYAGGGFTTAGGNPAHGIAQWNGSSWSALGSGMNGGVTALAVSDSTLYACGGFTTAGGNPANGLAQWNGSSWSALGSGIAGGSFFYSPSVAALAVSGSTLYAGGYFTNAGGSAANSIAQWNGSSWSALGSGIGEYGSASYVFALAVSGSTLYAGGDFATAGGNPANGIAQWNGSSWSALGSEMNNAVEALAVSGSTLYAGGYFTTAGGNTANCIAQWNGNTWSALGSGMGAGNGYHPYVSALAVSGSTLYAGGYFTTAGTNVSAYAAMASLAGTPVSPALALITANAAFSFTNGVFGFDVAGPAGSNVVIQASTNLQTWIPLQTNLLGSGLLHFSDAQSPANRHRFYRAQLSP
jgi:hypothetical protein